MIGRAETSLDLDLVPGRGTKFGRNLLKRQREFEDTSHVAL
jgi:hypothetical protein